MARKITVIALLAALWSAILPFCTALALPAGAAPEPGPGTAAGDQADVRPQFFARLKALADSGDLSDPAVVSQKLGMTFQMTSQEFVPQPPDCSEVWGARSDKTATAAVDNSSWYRVLPSGVGHMDVPAAFINRAEKTQDAKFEYAVRRRVSCSDRFRLQDDTSVKVAFAGLPSFACILPGDIQTFLPAAEHVVATDGVSLYRYKGRLDDDVGTYLEFSYRMGARCALDATVTQDQEYGLRYLRADSRRRNCEVATDKTFCAHHPKFTWGDGDVLDQMAQYADQVCGTVDALAKADKDTGQQPAPLPVYRRSGGPCD